MPRDFSDPNINPDTGLPFGLPTGPLRDGGGGGFGFLGDLGSSISNAVNSVGQSVQNVVSGVEKTVDAIIKNPLPVIETMALVAAGVPPSVASAAVTAINGGDVSQIATAAIGAYVASGVTGAVSDEFASANNPNYSNEGGAAGNVASNTPSSIPPAVVKAASSAIGADAGATTAALLKTGNLQQALDSGTKAAVTSLAASAGSAVGSEVASNIEDPTLANIAGKASKAGTTAALTGKDILSAATKAAKGDVLDAAGNVISQYAPDLSGSVGVDLSGIKDAIKPISDVATEVLQPFEQPIKDVAQKASDVVTSVTQPISDVATKVLQPAEQPIKDVIQAGQDAATTVLQPLENPIKDAATSVANTAKDITSTLPGVKISQADQDVMKIIAKENGTQKSSDAGGGTKIGDTAAGDTAIADTSGATDASDNISKTDTSKVTTKADNATNADTSGTTTIIGDTATGSSSTDSKGTSASPATYGGGDIAILEDVSGTLGSKGYKKGGKYPWGDPEGTTALKEGLGV
jgi:hypothetical protein